MKIRIQDIVKKTKGDELTLDVVLEVENDNGEVFNLVVKQQGVQAREMLENSSKMKESIMERIATSLDYLNQKQEDKWKEERVQLPKEFDGTPTDKEIKDYINKKQK